MLWKIRRSIPLKKISNIDVRRNPLEILMGIGQLLIFTPSTGLNVPEARSIGIMGYDALKESITGGSLTEAVSPVGSPPRNRDSSDRLLRSILAVLEGIESRLPSNS